MRLFRENMAKIPYAAPADSTGVEWFIRCVQRMILARQMLYEGIRICGDEEKVASTVVEKLRRGGWQLIYASACLQYAIDQYTYSLYGINSKFQMALEEELKLELFEAILNKYPRLNGTAGNVEEGEEEKKGTVPEWGERLFEEVEISIEEGQNLLRQKRTILVRGYKNLK